MYKSENLIEDLKELEIKAYHNGSGIDGETRELEGNIMEVKTRLQVDGSPYRPHFYRLDEETQIQVMNLLTKFMKEPINLRLSAHLVASANRLFPEHSAVVEEGNTVIVFLDGLEDVNIYADGDIQKQYKVQPEDNIITYDRETGKISINASSLTISNMNDIIKFHYLLSLPKEDN